MESVSLSWLIGLIDGTSGQCIANLITKDLILQPPLVWHLPCPHQETPGAMREQSLVLSVLPVVLHALPWLLCSPSLGLEQ